MRPGVRLAGFAALLLALFGGAAVAGSAIDPGGAAPGDGRGATSHGDGHEATAPPSPGGLAVAEDGLRLDAARTRLPAGGETATFAFRIADARGDTVRRFEVEQARRMHLVVVRRDLRLYQHLHPAQTAGGGWTVALRLPAAGVYRAFADFRLGGERRTLGIDLFAPGPFEPRELPVPSASAAVDGYDVTMREHGDELGFAIARDGVPTVDLQPYLGARGHLVALREGDLAYDHAHPLASGNAPNEIAFAAGPAAPGRHRLFLQFRHGGRVHTAAFTREVAP